MMRGNHLVRKGAQRHEGAEVWKRGGRMEELRMSLARGHTSVRSTYLHDVRAGVNGQRSHACGDEMLNRSHGKELSVSRGVSQAEVRKGIGRKETGERRINLTARGDERERGQ